MEEAKNGEWILIGQVGQGTERRGDMCSPISVPREIPFDAK
jgi:hypothetical protein